MEPRLLRYFVTLAETRHFGQAAARLHMAQSPLSQAIRRLEAQVGATLFDRTTRRVDLTPAGSAFLDDAARILTALDEARRRVQRIAGGSEGALTVGTTDLAAYDVLPRLARVAHRELPDVTLRFVPGMLADDQEAALAASRIDLGVLHPPVRDPALSLRLLARERMVVALPGGHRLGGPGPVRLADLADEDVVVHGGAEAAVDAVLLQACFAAGFVPRRREAGPTPILLTHVAAGQGVAALPESACALRVAGVEYRPLLEHIVVDLALAWRPADCVPPVVRLLDAIDASPAFPTRFLEPEPPVEDDDGSRPGHALRAVHPARRPPSGGS